MRAVLFSLWAFEPCSSSSICLASAPPSDPRVKLESIRELLQRGGDASERKKFLIEASVQLMQCVEDFADDDGALMKKARNLNFNIPNAFAFVDGPDLFKVLMPIMNEFTEIIFALGNPNHGDLDNAA